MANHGQLFRGWFIQLVHSPSVFFRYCGAWDALKNIVDAVRFFLAEYGRVAMHGGSVHAYYIGV